MEKPSISFFAMNFVLLFAMIGFVLVVFELHRFAFVIELSFLFVLISVLAFAMFAALHSKKWGWTIAAAGLILLLANLFFIFLLTGAFETAHLTALLFSVVGLVIALLSLRKAGEVGMSSAEQRDKSRDYSPFIEKMEPEPMADGQSVKKTFIPGKFIASRKASKFHSPKCDWAKRIGRENQLWFDSEEEAKAQGFQADGCVG